MLPNMLNRTRRLGLLLLLGTLSGSLLGTGCGGSSSGTFEGGLDPLDARVNTSSPAGTYAVRTPAICCRGRRVHVAWMDERVGQGDIRFNTSTNGTQTWLTNDLRVNTDIEGAALRRAPVVCCEGTNVYVAWTDFRLAVGTQIFFNYSSDSGRTFAPLDQRVSVNVGEDSFNVQAQMCCEGSSVYAVWVREETGAIYFNRSLNFGGTWLAVPRRLNPTTSNGSRPVICCEDEMITVAWEDDRNGALDIYTTSSQDGGTSWASQNQRLDTDSPGSAPSEQPRLCCAGARVYCAWRDQRDLGETVYTNFSSNRGLNWQSVDRRMDTSVVLPTGVESHSIQCANQYVHLVWTDNRNGELDVFYRRSINSGIAWEAPDVRIDAGAPGATPSVQVDLCANVPHVYATWSEVSGPGTSDWWFTYSTTNGSSGAAAPQQVNDTPPLGTKAVAGVLCCDGSDVFGAWVDTRNAPAMSADGAADIYSRGSQ